MDLKKTLIECIELSAIDLWDEIIFTDLYDIGDGGNFCVEEIKIKLNPLKDIKKLDNRFNGGSKFIGRNSIYYLSYPHNQEIIRNYKGNLFTGFLITIKFRNELQYSKLEEFVEKLNLTIESVFEKWTFKFVCYNDRIGAKMYLLKI